MCIRTNKVGEDSLIIVTEYKIYLLNLKTKTLSKGQEFCCVNTILLDNQYLYTLTA